MKVSQIHNEKKQSLSFEIFPPKKEEDFKNIDEMLGILCECNPEYISVTFGAGGSSNNNKTIEIAKKIKNEYHVEPVDVYKRQQQRDCMIPSLNTTTVESVQ